MGTTVHHCLLTNHHSLSVCAKKRQSRVSTGDAITRPPLRQCVRHYLPLLDCRKRLDESQYFHLHSFKPLSFLVSAGFHVAFIPPPPLSIRFRCMPYTEFSRLTAKRTACISKHEKTGRTQKAKFSIGEFPRLGVEKFPTQITFKRLLH